MSATATYVVTDIESDGPHPGLHSMLSFASVACDGAGATLGEFTAVLTPLPGHAPDAETMAWWATEPEAWRAATLGARDPAAVMAEYAAWLRALPAPRVFTAHPLIFDGGWIGWYLQRFLGLRLQEGIRDADPIFHGGGLDLGSLVMGRLGWPFARCNRDHYPAEWLGNHPHTHEAISDARGYASLLTTLLAEEPRR
jgi:hypothetical protein